MTQYTCSRHSTDSNSQTKLKERLPGAEWIRENFFLKKWDLKNRENLGRVSGRSTLSQKRKAYKEVENNFKNSPAQIGESENY